MRGQPVLLSDRRRPRDRILVDRRKAWRAAHDFDWATVAGIRAHPRARQAALRSALPHPLRHAATSAFMARELRCRALEADLMSVNRIAEVDGVVRRGRRLRSFRTSQRKAFATHGRRLRRRFLIDRDR